MFEERHKNVQRVWRDFRLGLVKCAACCASVGQHSRICTNSEDVLVPPIGADHPVWFRYEPLKTDVCSLVSALFCWVEGRAAVRRWLLPIAGSKQWPGRRLLGRGCDNMS